MCIRGPRDDSLAHTKPIFVTANESKNKKGFKEIEEEKKNLRLSRTKRRKEKRAPICVF